MSRYSDRMTNAYAIIETLGLADSLPAVTDEILSTGMWFADTRTGMDYDPESITVFTVDGIDIEALQIALDAVRFFIELDGERYAITMQDLDGYCEIVDVTAE